MRIKVDQLVSQIFLYLTVMLCFFLLFWTFKTIYEKEVYEKEAIVISVIDDEVEAEDASGHIQAFFDDRYNVGDTIILVMNNNNTPDLTDDIIISTKK